MSILKKIIKFLFYSLLLLVGYSLFSNAIGGLHSYFQQIYTEFPLCILFSGLIYLSLKPSKFRLFFAYLPLFVFYLGIDIYYIMFGEVFRLVSFEEAPEFLMLFDIFDHSFMLLTFLLIILIFARQVNFKKSYYLLIALSFIALLLYIVSSHPEKFTFTFESVSKEVIRTKASRNVKYNGKLATLLYEEANRHQTLKKLDNVDLTDTIIKRNKRSAFLKKHLKRPIFIFHLESFIDPTEFSQLQPPSGVLFNNDFMNSIQPYKGHVISPVFGGHTAQAEFEILCLSPALAQFSDIEFNGFNGKLTDCLANWVSMAGFPTTANLAYSPAYFNALKAYKSLGFKQIRYPKQYSLQQKHPLTKNLCGYETIMHDKELFEQSLRYYINNNQSISLTYSMGMFGHWPHAIDKTCHEDYVELDHDLKDTALERVINQYRYRTNAIAEFIPTLFSSVPDAIVLFISDHLPPMTDRNTVYKDLMYHNLSNLHPKTNIFYLFDSNKVIDMSKMKNLHHYQISEILLNLATEEKWCQEFSCSYNKNIDTTSLYNRYLTITKMASQ